LELCVGHIEFVVGILCGFGEVECSLELVRMKSRLMLMLRLKKKMKMKCLAV
jgi:hypothetical protein